MIHQQESVSISSEYRQVDCFGSETDSFLKV